jgi:hypothetical protein
LNASKQSNGPTGDPATHPRIDPPTVAPAEPGPKLTFPESTLHAIPWPDPVLDRLGHDPRSGYVERYWLPTMGPSCLLLLRRLAADLERNPDGFTIDTAQWAAEMGLGVKGGRSGPLWRSIDRACRFGAAHRVGDRLSVRRRLPPLTARQAQRLPGPLQVAHQEWVDARLDRDRRPAVAKWTPGHGRPDVPPPLHRRDSRRDDSRTDESLDDAA